MPPPPAIVASRPLGSMEHAMAQTHARFGLGAVGLVRLRSGPDPEALRRALHEAQARHPFLRARVDASGRTGRIEVIDPAPPIPLPVADWRSESDTRDRAQHLLNDPFEPGAAPLLRVVYLLSEDRADLLLAFHHAVMDATSGARLAHDLLSSATAASPASAEPRPLPSSSDALLPPSARGLRSMPGLVRFAGREMRADRRYARDTSPEQRPRVPPDAPTRIGSGALTEEQTSALVRRSRRERATMNGAIAAAMLKSVLARRYPPDTPVARVLLFSDLRRTLQPRPDDLACHVAMQRLAVPLGGLGSLDGAVWEVARRISGGLHEANQRGDKYRFARMARHVVRMEMKADRRRSGTIALTYPGVLPIQATYGDTEVLGMHAFITTNRLSPEFSAFGHLYRGRLHLDTMYTREDFSDDEADALLADVLRRLTDPAL